LFRIEAPELPQDWQGEFAHRIIQLRFSFRSEENRYAEEISIHAGFDCNPGRRIMGTGAYSEAHPERAEDSLAQIH